LTSRREHLSPAAGSELNHRAAAEYAALQIRAELTNHTSDASHNRKFDRSCVTDTVRTLDHSRPGFCRVALYLALVPSTKQTATTASSPFRRALCASRCRYRPTSPVTCPARPSRRRRRHKCGACLPARSRKTRFPLMTHLAGPESRCLSTEASCKVGQNLKFRLDKVLERAAIAVLPATPLFLDVLCMCLEAGPCS